MRQRPSLRIVAGSLWAGLLAFRPDGLGAQPASDGQLGPISRGSVHISLSVAPRLGAERAAARQAGAGKAPTQPFCIWSNGAISTFSVRASDASAGPDGDAVPYELEYKGPEDSRPLAIRPGTGLAGLASQSQEACRPGEGGPGGGLLVRKAGAASGTLLLLIAPD
jgi:hypothetical protein